MTTAVVALCAVPLVAAGVSAAATTLSPIPVKDDPAVTESAPTAHAHWFGWSQNHSRNHGHFDFYVQRSSGARVKVNAKDSQGLSGGIVGHRLLYLQVQRVSRWSIAHRIYRFDLRTRQRSLLPPKVNRWHVRSSYRNLWCSPTGNVSVSGRWLLYSASTVDRAQGEDWTVVRLYNRVTHRLRQIAGGEYRGADVSAGQVNGRYVTWKYSWGGEDPQTTIYRYDIKTGRTVDFPGSGSPVWQSSPGVSSDGTVYYFLTTDQPGGELLRQPAGGGAAEVVLSLTSGGGGGIYYDSSVGIDVFVRDRPDGTRVILYTWDGDVFKVLDSPDTTAVPRLSSAGVAGTTVA